MGWLSDKMFGKRKALDTDKLNAYMPPTQNLVNEQLGSYREMMDPNSSMNMQMQNMMQSNASTQGAQIGSQMSKMAAQTGMSPAQAMMHSRMAQKDATSGLNDQYMQYMQRQNQTGLMGMGNMTQMQQGLNENEANAYVQKINAHNAKRAGRVGFATSLMGTAISAATSGMGAPQAP